MRRFFGFAVVVYVVYSIGHMYFHHSPDATTAYLAGYTTPLVAYGFIGLNLMFGKD